jgi:hypothetical protein
MTGRLPTGPAGVNGPSRPPIRQSGRAIPPRPEALRGRDRMAQSGRRPPTSSARGERNAMHRRSLTAASVVAAALIACATNPATGKRQLMLMSEAQEGSLQGEVAFVSCDGKIYQIIGYAPAARFTAYPECVRRLHPELLPPHGPAVPGRPAQAPRARESRPPDGAAGVRMLLPLDGRRRDDRSHQRRRREPDVPARRAGQARRRRPTAGLGRPPTVLMQRRWARQSRGALNVSQLAGSPLCRPCRSQRTRISEEPWVHDSGAT